MPKGDAFTAPETPDVDGFDLRAWISKTAPVTRSCTVYGRPDLQGEIEALIDRLHEIQSSDMDDDRPLALDEAAEVSRSIEAKRAQMHASALRFRFRGLRNGELEEVKEEMGREDDDAKTITELDYRILAHQCIEPVGLTWEDFAALHANLGVYWVRTIYKTGNDAATGGGVDVPFSSASSALIANSSKN
jgi:hypothetical protein